MSGYDRSGTLGQLYSELEGCGYRMEQPQFLHMVNLWRLSCRLQLWDQGEEQLRRLSQGGCVSKSTFVLFFDEKLPKDREAFTTVIETFGKFAQQAAGKTLAEISDYWQRHEVTDRLGAMMGVSRVAGVCVVLRWAVGW